MTKINSFKLSTMMFLQFFVWGAWFVTLGTFLVHNLHATGVETGMAFATQSLGAVAAPFIVGLVADRFFHAQRILGVLHLAGAVLLYQMYTSTNFSEFYPYVLAYMVLFMPTLSLVNSVSFRQMSDPGKQFPPIRVWGTIGWIVAGLLISYLFGWDSLDHIGSGMLRSTFLLACVASIALGFFSFWLPETPPINNGNKTDVGRLLGLDAIGLLKGRNFLVFFVSSILICVPLAFYYQNANPFLSNIGMDNPTGKMTIGQLSEIVFLLLLPLFLKRFGFKWTLLFGMLAWGIRYALFAYGDVGVGYWMLLLGIALHGICYDFFFVAGQIYTDSKAGEHVKGAAQGLITFATYGVGMMIGFWTAGMITDRFTISAETYQWDMIWIIPAGIALFVMLLFGLLFKEKKRI